MHKILLVEDDKEFLKFLEKVLMDQGYQVTSTSDFLVAIQKVATESFDLIVSDLHLPDMLGTQLVKTVRSLSPQIKTMILTAEPTEATELDSIDYEVDLYVEKTKGIKVILRYIEVLLSRANVEAKKDALYSKSENMIIDFKSHSITKDDTEVKLTVTEFDLLSLLVKQPNTVFSRDEISQHLWKEPYDNSRRIDMHMKNLRVKLGLTSIVTVHGIGFKWYEQE